jgi:hypothetical protein
VRVRFVGRQIQGHATFTEWPDGNEVLFLDAQSTSLSRALFGRAQASVPVLYFWFDIHRCCVLRYDRLIRWGRDLFSASLYY